MNAGHQLVRWAQTDLATWPKFEIIWNFVHAYQTFFWDSPSPWVISFSYSPLYEIHYIILTDTNIRSKLVRKCSGNRPSARVNFGTNFEKFHLLRHKLTSVQVINFGTRLIVSHGAVVYIPILLGAEVNIWCRGPQVGAEIIPCRSYSCRKSIASQCSVQK